MRTRPVLAFLGLALVLAGCSVSFGGIDVKKAERIDKKLIQQQVGITVRSVTCPKKVKEKKGVAFSCAVVATDGTRGAVANTQTDDHGDVHITAPFLHPKDAERAMAAHYTPLVHAKVAVRCPQIIVVVKGRTFVCHATAAGSSVEVDAVLVDAAGHFTYRAKNTTGG